MLLLLDNYDSFVHNLARYLRNLGCETTVVRSDGIDVDRCRDLAPAAIVISPGPHAPDQAGCSVEVIQKLGSRIPILGICLGHQAIGVAFGGTIETCGPMHGMDSPIRHDRNGLFRGCPDPMRVGRYHSLAISPVGFPDELDVTARTDDGTIMGVRHKTLPIFGLQFHPESVLTPEGSLTLRNFLSNLPVETVAR